MDKSDLVVQKRPSSSQSLLLRSLLTPRAVVIIFSALAPLYIHITQGKSLGYIAVVYWADLTAMGIFAALTIFLVTPRGRYKGWSKLRIQTDLWLGRTFSALLVLAHYGIFIFAASELVELIADVPPLWETLPGFLPYYLVIHGVGWLTTVLTKKSSFSNFSAIEGIILSPFREIALGIVIFLAALALGVGVYGVILAKLVADLCANAKILMPKKENTMTTPLA